MPPPLISSLFSCYDASPFEAATLMPGCFFFFSAQEDTDNTTRHTVYRCHSLNGASYAYAHTLLPYGYGLLMAAGLRAAAIFRRC